MPLLKAKKKSPSERKKELKKWRIHHLIYGCGNTRIISDLCDHFLRFGALTQKQLDLLLHVRIRYVNSFEGSTACDVDTWLAGIPSEMELITSIPIRSPIDRS